MYQAKSGVKNFSLYWGGGGGKEESLCEKFFFSSLNMYQAKSGVKNFSLYRGVGVPPRKSCSEWAETNFGFGIFEIRLFPGGGSLCEIQMDRQPDTRHSDQISCSARRDSTTKKWTIWEKKSLLN